MLIIKAPIVCKSLSQIISFSDGLQERIESNYQLLGNGISGPELLHMISTPPELYLEEGGLASLVSYTDMNSRQNVKISVINQLLNRMLLHGTREFTYQDNVYITNVLHQLGIQDVKRFMKQVKNLREETDNMNQLINMYWEYAGELIYAVKELKEREPGKVEKQPTPEAEEQEKSNYLHQEIYNRLQTGAIYHLIQNFYKSQPNAYHQVLQTEILVSEQAKVAQNILLNKLKNTVLNESNAVMFHRINLYEMDDIEEVLKEGKTEERILSDMVSAVLLNMTDNLYSSRFTEFVNGNKNYYELRNTIFQTSENTLKRFEDNHRNRLVRNESSASYTEERNQVYQKEIKALQKLFNTVSRVYEAGFEEIEAAEAEKIENPVFYDNSYANSSKDTHIIMQHIDQKTVKEGGSDSYAENSQEYYEEIKKQLEIVNQHNVEAQKQVMQITNKLPQIKSLTVDRKKAQKDVLRAMENPQEVLREYLSQSTETEIIKEQTKEKVEALYTEETKEILKRLKEYSLNPEKAMQEGKVTVNQESLFFSEVQRVFQQENGERKVRAIAEDVAEAWKEPFKRTEHSVKQMNENIQEVSLIHKKSETEISQDVLEKVMQESHTKRQKKLVEENTVTEKNEFHNILNQTNSAVTIENKESMEQLVQKGVQKQLGILSEEVYMKLEKKLQNERKRRGY